MKEIDFYPTTKEELVRKTLAYVKDKLKIDNPIAIYISGSRLRRWNTEKSDFDLFAIVKEDPEKILYGKFTSQEKHFNIDKIVVDLNIKGFSPLYKMIINGDPNVIELFSEKPLWTSEDLYRNEQSLNLIKWLNEPQGHDTVLQANFIRFVKAGAGMIKSAKKKLQHHKTIRASKDLATAALWLDYADEAIVSESFPNPEYQMNVSEAYTLRRRIGDNALTEEEILQETRLLEEKATILKEKAYAKNVDYDEQSRQSRAMLSAKFVRAVG